MIDAENPKYRKDNDSSESNLNETLKGHKKIEISEENEKISGRRPFHQRNLSTSRIDQLKNQRATIEARIQSAEARLKTQNRKQDTRRKILIGSYYLDKAVKENTYENLKLLMCGYLTRESDKKLFGFSPHS